MKEILVATTNFSKLKEFRDILKNYDVKSLKDYPSIPEIEETEDTIEGNAKLKAETVANLLGIPTLADDTGLFVEALNGEPGVKSARWASDHNDDINCNYLIEVMKNQPNRKAYYATAIAFAVPNKNTKIFLGKLYGRIAEKGSELKGFAYDKYFIPDGYEKTLNEIKEKNSISHRAIAIKEAMNYLKLRHNEIGLDWYDLTTNFIG